MQDLYSLDLSFCTEITGTGIENLLRTRAGDSLSELRLRSCRGLEIYQPDDNDSSDAANRRRRQTTTAGEKILAALRFHGHGCCLSVLDVRQCWEQQLGQNFGRREKDPFVIGMAADLKFEQKLAGYFVRPATWNPDIERRLVKQLGFGDFIPIDD